MIILADGFSIFQHPFNRICIAGELQFLRLDNRLEIADSVLQRVVVNDLVILLGMGNFLPRLCQALLDGFLILGSPSP